MPRGVIPRGTFHKGWFIGRVCFQRDGSFGCVSFKRDVSSGRGCIYRPPSGRRMAEQDFSGIKKVTGATAQTPAVSGQLLTGIIAEVLNCAILLQCCLSFFCT